MISVFSKAISLSTAGFKRKIMATFGFNQEANIMRDAIDDFIKMNQAGLILELCEKYYAENVVMLNNGVVFAKSMRESYDKQKGFTESISEIDIKLLSKEIAGNTAELTFDYTMTEANSNIIKFVGKHVQKWENGKIAREEFFAIEDA
ncbi:MAG: hypothetical protein ACI93R_003766 [Flavobacteriales bacterium]|jgi:hypothetical protein